MNSRFEWQFKAASHPERSNTTLKPNKQAKQIPFENLRSKSDNIVYEKEFWDLLGGGWGDGLCGLAF